MQATVRALALLALPLAVFSGAARAAQLIAFEIIPASACEPVSDGSKLRLTQGAWEFAEGQSGTVTLRCPVRSSFFFIDGAQLTQDVVIASLMAYFSDPDDEGNTYGVTLRLRKSDKNDTSASVVGDHTFAPSGPAAEEYAEDCVNGACPVYVMLDAQYHIDVLLTRNSLEANPHFTATGLTSLPPG